MSQLQQFQFGLVDLRVIELEGQPWFIAVDVCGALGMFRYASDYTNKLETSERRVLRRSDLKSPDVIRGVFQNRTTPTVTLVSESGLYKLVMRSDKPDAKAFQDWVTRVVLPAIRKDGSYVLGEEKVATGEMSEEELFAKAVLAAHNKIDRITKERDQAHRERNRIAEQNRILEVEKPHLVEFNQRILPATQEEDAVGAI